MKPRTRSTGRLAWRRILQYDSSYSKNGVSFFRSPVEIGPFCSSPLQERFVRPISRRWRGSNDVSVLPGNIRTGCFRRPLPASTAVGPENIGKKSDQEK